MSRITVLCTFWYFGFFHLWPLDETADLLKGLVNNTRETFLAVQTAWRKKVSKAGSALHRQCME